MKVLGIDPGSEESALFGWDSEIEKILYFSILKNSEILGNFGYVKSEHFKCVAVNSSHFLEQFDIVVCENIGHYGTGMAVGNTVFDTCRYIGKLEVICCLNFELILCKTIRAHHTGSARAKDGNIIQALKDRFEPGLKPRQRPKGLFKGVSRDIWQAAAVAIYWGDMEKIGFK